MVRNFLRPAIFTAVANQSVYFCELRLQKLQSKIAKGLRGKEKKSESKPKKLSTYILRLVAFLCRILAYEFAARMCDK